MQLGVFCAVRFGPFSYPGSTARKVEHRAPEVIAPPTRELRSRPLPQRGRGRCNLACVGLRRELRFCGVRPVCAAVQAAAVVVLLVLPRLSSIVRMAFFASVGDVLLDWKAEIALVS